MATVPQSTELAKPYKRCQCCANDDTVKGLRFGTLRFNGKDFRICSKCVDWLWQNRGWANNDDVRVKGTWYKPWTW